MPVDKFGRMSDLKTKDTGVSLTYINNNYVRSDGDTPLSGSLDMRGNTIYNVADPVNPQDVVTKVYVDNTKGSGVIGRKVGDSVSIKENMDFLGKQKIKNLPDPVNDHDAVTKKYVDEKDAVTKKYVDDKTKNLFIDKNDNIAFGLNVDMEGNKIFSLPKPEQDHEPATKKYVDDLQTHYIDKRGNVRFDRNINVGNNRIFALKDPKKDYEATNKKYVDETINKRLQEEKDNFLPQDPATKEYVDEAIKQVAGGDILVSKEGVFIKANGHYRATASLDIDNHKMENLPDPVDDKDAVNKKYIDGIIEALTLKQGLIRENGGFNLVDSYINMNFNNIRNVGNPIHGADAVPRSFVDDMIKELEEKMQKVEEKIKQRKQLISETASYHGDLIKGDYQFTWGGSSMALYKKHDAFSGFLVPSDGYIKKFVVFPTGLKFNAQQGRGVVEFVVYDMGYNNHVPLFSLVKISGQQDPIDIGILYFYFTDYGIARTGEIKYVFKFNPDVDEKTLRTVKKRDIINIRSEFDSIDITGYRIMLANPNYKIITNDFFTYLATVLIELDPL